jgi:hypothetical protein
MSPLIAGGARFWRPNFALFLGSFATFAMPYCVQSLMPSMAPLGRPSLKPRSRRLRVLFGSR